MNSDASKKKNEWIEAFGWASLVMLLVAYGLVSFGFWTGDGVWYQVLNIVGSAGIAWIAFAKKDSQPAILNAIWVLIGVVSLIRLAIHP